MLRSMNSKSNTPLKWNSTISTQPVEIWCVSIFTLMLKRSQSKFSKFSNSRIAMLLWSNAFTTGLSGQVRTLSSLMHANNQAKKKLSCSMKLSLSTPYTNLVKSQKLSSARVMSVPHRSISSPFFHKTQSPLGCGSILPLGSARLTARDTSLM